MTNSVGRLPIQFTKVVKIIYTANRFLSRIAGFVNIVERAVLKRVKPAVFGTIFAVRYKSIVVESFEILNTYNGYTFVRRIEECA